VPAILGSGAKDAVGLLLRPMRLLHRRTAVRAVVRRERTASAGSPPAARSREDWTSHAADSFRYLALTLDRKATQTGFHRRIEYSQVGVV
jgi:hypothetical protein